LNVLLIFVVLFLIVTAAAVYAKAQVSGLGPAQRWPFQIRKPLSNAEQVLYFRLRKVLPDHIVLAQVQLSRILCVKEGNSFHIWNNRINRLSADFVICTKDASVAAVIELDDASHHRYDRRIADAKKEKALRSAGVRLLRWQARELPDEAAILAEVLGDRAKTTRIHPPLRADRISA
jgi:very-short-patch-repair endonuclease